jgi:hypothetical protein
VKCCKKHYAAIRALVASKGYGHLDNPAEVPPEACPDVNAIGVMVSTLMGEGKDGPADLRPTVCMLAGVYQSCLQEFGPGTMDVCTDPTGGEDGHFCPLCLDRQAYDIHLRGECTNSDCDVGDVRDEMPWDEAALKMLGEDLQNYVVEHNIAPLQ